MGIEHNTIDTSCPGWIKSIFYIIIGASTAVFDYIDVKSILVGTLTLLMVLDWITGLLKAWKLKIPITSKRSGKGLVEKLILLVIPVAIGITMKAIGFNFGVTVNAIFAMLCVAELYSLIGNCYCIYTGVDEKEFDAVTAVIKFVRSNMIKGLKNLLKEK